MGTAFKGTILKTKVTPMIMGVITDLNNNNNNDDVNDDDKMQRFKQYY